jgi:mycothiol synthase
MADSSSEIVIRPIEPADGAAVYRLRQAAIDAGELPGADPHSEAYWVPGIVGTGAETLVAEQAGRVVGFASGSYHLAIVDPSVRRRGIGRRLIEGVERSRQERDREPPRFWLPDGRPGAGAFLESMGYAYHSSGWRFRLPAGRDFDPPSWPTGIATRAYDHDDLEPYSDLINRAFADHPTRIQVTPERVHAVHSLPGFDPTTILVATPATDPRTLLGFARIEFGQGAEDEPEVDFIGVDPEWQRRGLGRALLAWAVNELRHRGAGEIVLNVEAANEAATSLYRSVGFAPDVEYRRWARR